MHNNDLLRFFLKINKMSNDLIKLDNRSKWLPRKSKTIDHLPLKVCGLPMKRSVTIVEFRSNIFVVIIGLSFVLTSFVVSTFSSPIVVREFSKRFQKSSSKLHHIQLFLVQIIWRKSTLLKICTTSYLIHQPIDEHWNMK